MSPLSTLMIVVVVVVVVVVAVTPSGADTGSTRRSTEGRTRRPIKRIRPTTEATTLDEIPYWMCPDVACAPLSSTCATVEYIVYETPYVVNGNQVRCQSCPYCLDMPSSGQLSRRKRSSSLLLQRLSEVATQTCQLTCPEVQDSCMTWRMTSVHLGGAPCGQCPVCYDSAPQDVTSLQNKRVRKHSA